MTTWKDARFDCFYYDAAADTNEPCEVALSDEGELTVSYWDDDINCNAVYKGKEAAPGLFELTAPMVEGHATLHQLPDASLLEGFWQEGKKKGMWRIKFGQARNASSNCDEREAVPKSTIGRLCEFLVKEIIEHKTGYVVENINDIHANHPVTDLRATSPLDHKTFEVSVKAKTGAEWPKVKGITGDDHYIVFVDVRDDHDPEFYILNKSQWDNTLKDILPTRDPNSKKVIKNGAIELRWTRLDGKPGFQRGSKLLKPEVAKYKDAWHVLPVCDDRC